MVEAKYVKSGLNAGTERNAIELVLEDKRFQKPASALKSRILKGIHPDMGDWSQKTFDLILTSIPRDDITESNLATLLDDIRVVEVKTTRKPIRNRALNNFFFGSTDRQYLLARALGDRHRYAFAVLNSDNDYGRPFFVLLTLEQVEKKTRTKRLQYQVNFRSDMRPDEYAESGPFPLVQAVAMENAPAPRGASPAP